MSQSDIINSRQIQWFPGHMTKTLRLMEKEIRNVDCVLQILDARIPLSSLNPEIERITAGKPHLYVLNKSDLADPEITRDRKSTRLNSSHTTVSRMPSSD